MSNEAAPQWSVSPKDRQRLRELARQQAEFAALPVMQLRIKRWYAHNDMQGACPMIHIEVGTFAPDIVPPLECESDTARQIENQLIMNMINHMMIDDDRVVPDYYGVYWWINFRLFDLDIKRVFAKDTRGYDLGYHIDYPITDLEKQIDELKPSVISVDKQGSLAYKQFIEEIFGDILPVRFISGTPVNNPSYRLIELMGMEAVMISMKECPEALHRLTRMVTDDYIRYHQFCEQNELLVLNNGNDWACQGTFSFTHELPAEGHHADHVRLRDMWGYLDSQESVGYSPAAYHEFVGPYYHELASLFGIVNYGCCEPVHPYWSQDIQYYPNVRKISISPWCDENYMGEALKGRRTIFHRKPSPSYLSAPGKLDTDAFSEHIIKTLKAAKGCKLEFSYRDVYTLGGDVNKPREATALMRRLFDKHWQP